MSPKAKTSRAKVGKKTARRKTAAPRPRSPLQRKGLIELAGKPATVIGPDARVGRRAPRFKGQVGSWAGHDTWAVVDPLALTAGKVRILAAVPSLDTSVCDAETRRFNQEAAALGDEIVILTISADLPITQKRWCGAAGVDRVYTVSDHDAVEFGRKYGVLIKERRYFRRAVFVVGRDDTLRYVAYMPILGVEPDYEAVLAAARQALAG